MKKLQTSLASLLFALIGFSIGVGINHLRHENRYESITREAKEKLKGINNIEEIEADFLQGWGSWYSNPSQMKARLRNKTEIEYNAIPREKIEIESFTIQARPHSISLNGFRTTDNGSVYRPNLKKYIRPILEK